ncbi:hypothetical protein Bca4012_003971 [Brassica carinata]
MIVSYPSSWQCSSTDKKGTPTDESKSLQRFRRFQVSHKSATISQSWYDIMEDFFQKTETAEAF